MLNFTRIVRFSRFFPAAISKSNLHKGPWNILYFGTDDFAVGPLDGLNNSLKGNSSLINSIEVVCPAEKRRLKDIKQKNKISTVRQFAEANRLSIHDWPLDRKNSEFLSRFHLGIVVSFGHFIPPWIISSLLCGAINIHPSLLPKWRGPSPIVHTLLDGDTETGVSIIDVSPKKFDAGKILVQQAVQIPRNKTYEDLSEELSLLSSEMLLDVLTNFSEFRASAVRQDESEATEAPKVAKETGYVKWNEFTCEDIERLWRAIGHRFGLKCKWNDELVVRLESFSDSRTLPPGAPDNAGYGQPFYDSSKNVLYINCKDGWVGWTSLKIQYRKSITAKEFYNGYLVDKETGKNTSSVFHNMT